MLTDTLLPRRKVLEVVPVAVATLYRWMDGGSFPRPVKVGPNRVMWRESDIQAWLASRQTAKH